MGKDTNIEWATHTFNPWVGCQKVSDGCDNCYAEALMDHRFGQVQWGPHGARKRTGAKNWNDPLKWNEAAKENGVRARVFCASLSDWLDNKVPQSWRDDLALLIDETPHLDWLLLTKRIENFERFNPWAERQGALSVPLNVWVGVTAENQEAYDRRWPHLAKIITGTRFISYEPAIGPLTLKRTPFDGFPDWVICGGETGKKARWMKAQWAEQLLAECEDYRIAFFMKQMTAKATIPGHLQVRQLPNVWGIPNVWATPFVSGQQND